MTVLQFSELAGALALREPRPGMKDIFIACCGQAAPNLVAWRTPANVRGGSGGANRRFPTLFKRRKDIIFSVGTSSKK